MNVLMLCIGCDNINHHHIEFVKMKLLKIESEKDMGHSAISIYYYIDNNMID